MKLKEGIGWPSDIIAFRTGLDGHEPKDVANRIQRIRSDQIRVAVAINTHYSEVCGGFYFNRYLLALVQNCLRQAGLLAVNEQFWDESNFVPIELDGSLLEDEQYLLVSTVGEDKGGLLMWHFPVGGGGAFYGDSVIVDLILPQNYARIFENILENECSKKGVSFKKTDGNQ